MSAFLTLVGLAGLGVALVALVKGSLPALHLANRKNAGVLLAASFVTLGVGGAISPPAYMSRGPSWLLQLSP